MRLRYVEKSYSARRWPISMHTKRLPTMLKQSAISDDAVFVALSIAITESLVRLSHANECLGR